MLAWWKVWKKRAKIWRAEGEFEWVFKMGKPSSNTLNVGAPTFLGVNGPSGLWARAGLPKQPALEQFHFADLNGGLRICVVRDVTFDFSRVGHECALEGFK